MSISALSTALCLPALDIEALLQGRTIAAISSTFRNPSRFLLFPVDLPLRIGQLEARYQAQFLSSFKATYTAVEEADTVMVQAWAKCKTCRIFGERDNLAALSALTAWTPEYLHELVQERHKIFVLFLQVHRFADPLKLVMPRIESDQISTYISVPGSWSDQGAMPLLDQETFGSRQKQLIKLTPPLHVELQALQRALVFEREYSLGAMALDRDIRYLLGWSRAEETQMYDSDLSWIQQVASGGNSDDKAEFQELVRRCLVKLGFTCYEPAFESSADDAASEIDKLGLCCQSPYVLFAKCEANQPSAFTSRSADSAAAHFQQVETSHQKREGLEVSESESYGDSAKTSVRVIFSALPLTERAQQTTKRNRINVIRPETLQRLTEVKARYPGAVDLIKLKECLQTVPYGEAADERVIQFVEETLFRLKIRATVIKAVKVCLERTGQESVGTDTVCGAYATISTLELPRLSVGEMQDILVELSSPLAGYLGRDRASNGRALFYFLRELNVEDISLMTMSE